MNTTTYKRWMPPGRGLLAALLTLCCCFISQMAWADYDCTYSSDGGDRTFEHECPHCGIVCQMVFPKSEYSYDEAYDYAQDVFADKKSVFAISFCSLDNYPYICKRKKLIKE